MTSYPQKWTKTQIRQARKTHLAPLLKERGYHLIEHPNNNHEIREHPNLIIKESYWHWPDKNQQGNTIDLFTQVLGKTFTQAMNIIHKEE